VDKEAIPMELKYFVLLIGAMLSFSLVTAADLTVSGDLTVGSTPIVSIDRGTSVNARLLQSPTLQIPPRVLGNLGTLYLKRNTIGFLPQSATTNWGGGSTITDVEVYLDPLKYSVGDVMYFQGLKIGPWLVLEGLTNDYVSITVAGTVVPGVPQNVVASDGNEQIKITWNALAPAPEYYYVYRRLNSAQNWENIGETIKDETYFTDTEATLGQSFEYAVIAKGNSQLSNVDIGSVSSTKGMKWSHKYHMFIDPFEIGDSGSKLFANSFSTFWVESFLFSTTDSNPPTPIFTVNNYPPTMHNFMGRGVAARYAGVYANPTMADYPNSGYGQYSANFRRYDGSSNNPTFEYISPDATLCCNGQPQTEGAWVSDDGSKIISFMPTTNSKTRLVTFDSTGAITKDHTFDFKVVGWWPNYAFSGDGSHVALGNSPNYWNMKLVNTNTGAIVLDKSITSGYIYDVSLDYAGSRMAVALGGDSSSTAVRVYETPFASSNEYDLFIPTSHPLLTQHQGQVSLSDDGTKLAYAYSGVFVTGAKRGGVLLWDITNLQNPILLVDNTFETNPVTAILYHQWIDELAISADGNRFVVGLWGDGTSESSNVRVFESGINDPIAEFNTPIVDKPNSWMNGVQVNKVTTTVHHVDISPDGTRIAAGIKGSHANTLGGFKEVNVYHVA
jgi:hypothetical protein